MSRRTKAIVRRVKSFVTNSGSSKLVKTPENLKNRKFQASLVRSSRKAPPGTLAHTIYRTFKEGRIK